MKALYPVDRRCWQLAPALSIAMVLLATPAVAQSGEGDPIGICDPALADRLLDANNVRARIVNNGGLFYRGEPHIYQVPRFSNSHAIFSASIWIGGLVDGALHIAASRYGPYEFWAGPLDDNGLAPDDCSLFDRIYKITRDDLDAYEQTGVASGSLSEWPTGLGAPTVDADGNRIDFIHRPLAERLSRKIDLDAGELPDLPGDEALWWVMNDRGNVHEVTDAPSLGIEVHGLAYAAASMASALNDATLYRYTIINRTAKPISKTYFGVFVDPDLGDAGDDYIGSDSVKGIAFVYNADNSDTGGQGYGEAPPAVGFRVLRGPLADNDGFDNDRDGLIDEPGERPGMSHFHTYYGGGCPFCDPGTGQDYYNYMQSRWKNGERVLEGGSGYSEDGGIGPPVNYFYPGDPVTGAYWSEVNTGGQGEHNSPYDRRFVLSSGPFDLAPGEAKEIDFAIVYGRGNDNFDSINVMRRASDGVQATFDSGFVGYAPGSPPESLVQPLSPAEGVPRQPTTLTVMWEELTAAEGYSVELVSDHDARDFESETGFVEIPELESNTEYRWRVRQGSSNGNGPWSESRSFVTGSGPIEGFPLLFSTVANAAGPLNPPDLALYALSGSPYPVLSCPTTSGSCSHPTPGYQQSSNASVWAISYSNARSYASIVSGITERGRLNDTIGASDYEWRWVGLGSGGMAHTKDFSGGIRLLDVGFELWNIGVGTPDDPADDYRMIPHFYPTYGEPLTFNIGYDHGGFGGPDDPYLEINWFNPSDTTPGESGYNRFITTLTGLGEEVFRYMRLVQIDGGAAPPYDIELPETGTVFRITHGSPAAPILASPADESYLMPGQVQLFWTGLDASFRVQVSTRFDFSSTVMDVTSAVSGFDLTLGPAEEYFWRVWSASTGWSETWSFITLENPGTETENAPVADLRNYPNPFDDTATIRFYVREATQVRIEMTDVLGRRVRTVLDEVLSIGPHAVPVDARSLSNGVYFYTLVAGDHRVTKSMVVVR